MLPLAFTPTVTVALLAATSSVWAQDQYGQHNYQDPSQLPAKVDQKGGQVGYNDCIDRYGGKSDGAMCQNFYLNSVTDFCLPSPSAPNKGTIGDQEEILISFCLKEGYGTRLIPDGTIAGAHFLKTPQFVQVTGTGDLTKINIERGDEGGELDPHGATGSGNPVGGLVFTNARGNWERLSEWSSFVSSDEFCFRACFGESQASRAYCQHIYDEMGCEWNEPANYDQGVWEDCEGEPGEWPGVYNGSTWYQGQSPTPSAQPAGASSNCKYHASVSTGQATKVPGQ